MGVAFFTKALCSSLFSVLNNQHMRLATEIYTHRIEESRAFYCNHFGFRVKLEMEGFIILQHEIELAYELLFCVPDSPFVHKIFRPEFCGNGMIFQLEVEDVEKE